MEMDVINRRTALASVATIAVGATVASCTQTQIDDVAAKVADLINQVQKGVAEACAAAGKFVPTANSVLQVLIAVVGGASVLNPALVTAAMVLSVIQQIAAQCPAAPQARGAAPHTAVVHGVNVVFY